MSLQIDGQTLILQRALDAATELRGFASQIPEARSLVDELLEKRRLAAAAGE